MSERTNHYAFHCPVIEGAAFYEDCAIVHAQAMKGEHRQIERPICALAHQCDHCPFKTASRVKGLWSHYDTRPHWDDPREQPDKLPKALLVDAFRNTIPKLMELGRAAIPSADRPGYLAHFQKLQDWATGHDTTLRVTIADANKTSRKPKPTKAPAPKPATAADAIAAQSDTSMADALNEAVAKDKRESAQKSRAETQQPQPAPVSPRPAKRTPAKRSASEGSDPAPKKMSLAERARQMKQRKEAS